MSVDFLRHVVNPVLTAYMNKGLPPKVANELRKAIAQAEDKYKFNAFTGDPSNILRYLESREFAELVNLSKTLKAEHVLAEILRVAAEMYRPLMSELARAFEKALKFLEEAKVEVVTAEEKLSLDKIAEVLKKYFSAGDISLQKNVLHAKLGNEVEIKVKLLKSGVKLEFKINTLEVSSFKALMGRVKSLVEKISSI